MTREMLDLLRENPLYVSHNNGRPVGDKNFWAVHHILRKKIPNLIEFFKVEKFLKSTWHKKLATNALWFTYWILKSYKLHEKMNKEHQTLSFQFFKKKSSILMCFVFLFHVVCNISNVNMWTEKYFTQASYIDLTLKRSLDSIPSSSPSV